MKKIALLFGLALLSLQSCIVEVNENGTGGNYYYSCIDEEIDYFAHHVACIDFAKVDKYRFQGEIVYAFFPGDCTNGERTQVFTEDCYNIGFLGGTHNNKYINGINFYTHAQFLGTVWAN